VAAAEGVSGRALLFELREGGRCRIELSYQDGAQGTGKDQREERHQRWTLPEARSGRRVVTSVEFGSDDPASAGGMIMTWISAEDNAATFASTLENLACFVAAR
jgi:hypothetical protein